MCRSEPINIIHSQIIHDVADDDFVIEDPYQDIEAKEIDVMRWVNLRLTLIRYKVYVDKIQSMSIMNLRLTLIRYKGSESEDHIAAGFKSFDANKDGGIDPQEVRAIYRGLMDQADLFKFYAEADKNEDGLIDIDEYRAYIKSL
ncbi:troponin C, skeletal muscle, putative [Perkinsus marinus ATCC 50983]|uniref:Troponin C, skeletal muscle, putative n=1 Tax=Perkinsus marinus (strain ATCC 50983 / TXsc) TaxID=423536 RepID=C5K5Q1_PERM5|nr:troponin C, skeletal muscle, putative [Perkinsus marinus ATCC 50983]EER20208.1 troponin C, skeletal muscle, putative [Perkinsus marinus ATCC 50983]|eukprot:XP_002788412.1 troponin C, skeletal muscle, putative [Perkinsus marinus ATCC 50983]